jgi:hypothetical protein
VKKYCTRKQRLIFFLKQTIRCVQYELAAFLRASLIGYIREHILDGDIEYSTIQYWIASIFLALIHEN